MTTKRAPTPISCVGPLNWRLGRHETGGAAVLLESTSSANPALDGAHLT